MTPRLLGREHHLAVLMDALAASREGHPVTVFVHGPRGMGRSALLRRFFEAARAVGAVVLEGSAERGSIAPFAALEGVARRLADHLARLPAHEAERVTPRHARALARVLPELARVRAIAAAAPDEAPDPVEVRRRAGEALREVLAAIAERGPLIVSVDELQWGDEDSARLLLEVLRGEGAPAMVLLAGYRSGEVARVALACALRRTMGRGEPVGDLREVLLGPLAPREARTLARELLGRSDVEGSDDEPGAGALDPGTIARVSGGSPGRVVALVERALAGDLEAGDEVETDAEDAQIDRATAESAGDRAAEALAFHRSVELYRAAQGGSDDPRALAVKLARALVGAGQREDAARVYLDTSALAEADEAPDLRCCAAEQELRAGRADEGLTLARGSLEAAGLALAKTPGRARSSLLYERARLALRGLEPCAREDAPEPAILARLDAGASLVSAVAPIDPIRAAPTVLRHLRAALDVGDLPRIARALASAAISAAREGGPGGRARAADLLARSAAIAGSIGPAHPEVIAVVTAAGAAVAFHALRFGEAVELSLAAIEELRAGARDSVAGTSAVIASWLLPSLLRLGNLDELGARARLCLDEVDAAGDHASAQVIRATVLPYVWLAEGKPREAQREAFEAIARCGSAPVRLGEVHATARVLLYQGDGEGAHRHVAFNGSAIEASSLLRLELARIEATHLRASCALAAAPRGGGGDPLRRAAERDARALEGEQSPYAAALAASVRAGLAAARGEAERAATGFGEAAAALDALGLGLLAAAMRRRRGELALGEEGRALIDDADRWTWTHGIRDSARTAAMLAPLGP